ncbi:unnamed protein product [Meganyctiphanes norvegica]|uniref:Tyrosine-protein kinase Drl n=1 Tax=Meganyctiphanes norvegica TaxID=48144 RepID=A0AAV2PK64_MEGNR
MSSEVSSGMRCRLGAAQATDWTSMMLLLHALLQLLLCTGSTRANFDLYLTKPEVKRTLGLDAELYYVQDGVLNDYALTYRVLVAADIHSLYFTWKATARKPVLYNIGIFVNETEGSGGGSGGGIGGGSGTLAPPQLNVSLSGEIPVSETTFRMDLPCTGLVSAEVFVVLNINVTAPRPRLPPTELYIVRRKVCLQGQSGEKFIEQLSSVEEEPSEEEHMSPLYYVISVLAGLTLVLAIVFIVAALRNRSRKNNRHHIIINSDLGMSVKECMRSENGCLLQQSDHQGNNKYLTEVSVPRTSPSYISHKPGTVCSAASSIAASYAADKAQSKNGNLSRNRERNVNQMVSRDCSSRATTQLSRDDSSMSKTHVRRDSSSRATTHLSRSSSSSRTTTNSSSSLSKSELLLEPFSMVQLKNKFINCQVERERVRLTSLIQEGGYGRLYHGHIQSNLRVNDQQAIIKSLSSDAPHEEVVSLCREGIQMFNLHHRNILALTGISFDDNSPPLLIYPQRDYHNLKLYLREHRSGHLVAGELLELSVQAAHGLSFLHKSNILHGDIASRNCLVSGSFQLLLCDAALSRNLFPEDYETDHYGTSRPLKWMAYEAITEHIIISASDVWSYGVLLWELTSLAQQPYVEVASIEMADYLRDGYRLVQPKNCPDDLYKVMAFCWAIHAIDRPNVNLILDYLADFSKQLNNFV